MEELVKLMDELTVALKARAEAGAKATALAREVKSIPKLSVIAPYLASECTDESADHVLEQLQWQMELQNLLHARDSALDLINSACSQIASLRIAVNQFQSAQDSESNALLDTYDAQIQEERAIYAELQQKKQNLLFRLNEKMNYLQKLSDKAPNTLSVDN